MATGSYLDRLAARQRTAATSFCLGIDPDPECLPDGWRPDLPGIEAFASLVLESAGRHAAAVKVNLAFFEAWGSGGVAALERLRRQVPADLPFIADAKRGDISSTSLRHAAWLFDRLGADAVTASPYTGEEGIAPLLERADRFVYVLCRTSNPGAGEFQDLLVVGGGDDEARMDPGQGPLYLHVARRVAAWDAGRGTCGLVVGATAPERLASVRAATPGLPFLVPGVGRQGGDLGAVRSHGPALSRPSADLPGGGLLVNVSRPIAESAAGARDPGTSLDEAGRLWASELRV